MCYSPVNVPSSTRVVADVMEVRTSADLLNWTEATAIYHEGKPFGNHYIAMVSEDDKNQPCVIDGDEFSILTNHNGTDVTRHKAKFVKKA